jgi:hypothetical protein
MSQDGSGPESNMRNIKRYVRSIESDVPSSALRKRSAGLGDGDSNPPVQERKGKARRFTPAVPRLGAIRRYWPN